MTEDTILSPLEDDGVYIDSLIFETTWLYSNDADELSLQLAYDYDAQIPRDGAGPSDIRVLRHRSGAIGINLNDLAHMRSSSSNSAEDSTYSPKVGMIIDLYVMYDWRESGVELSEDDEPPAYARVHVRGQFSASRDSFPSGVTDDEITQWIGTHAIDIMYEKAKRAVEERLYDSCMGWQKLPIINARSVWENSRFVGERYDSGIADIIDSAFEDGSFWDDVQVDDSELEEESVDELHAESLVPGSDSDSSDIGSQPISSEEESSLDSLSTDEFTKAQIAALGAWTRALFGYLEEHASCSEQSLMEELIGRISEGEPWSMELVNKVAQDAIDGSLGSSS